MPLTTKDKQFAEYQRQITIKRNTLLIAAAKDDNIKRAIIKQCSEDVLFFINYFIITYNPREKDCPYLPLVLFPRQEEMIKTFNRAYKEGKWCIVNKSRYTGASVISIAYLLHKFLFTEGFSGSLSSNKADSVDRIGDPDSLFGKLEQMYRSLPNFLKPFKLEGNRKIKLMVNPLNGSNIKGYSGRDIGRGGRSTIAFVDEIAHLEHDDDAVAAMSENTDCMIAVSTPKGTGCQHYKLFKSEGTISFTFSWKDDPRRDAEWEKAQRLKLGDVIFEQELNCSFTAFEGSSFLKREDVEYLFNNDYEMPTVYGQHETNQLVFAGLDLANGGDKTVLSILVENTVVAIYELAPKINDAFEELRNYVTLHNVHTLAYDQCGLGQFFSAINDLNRNGSLPCGVEPYNAAGTMRDKYIPWYDRYFQDVFYNNRAYMYSYVSRCAITARQLSKRLITPDAVLSADMPLLRFAKRFPGLEDDLYKAGCKFRGGKLLIESKEDMKKDGKSSTDISDSVMIALWAKIRNT